MHGPQNGLKTVLTTTAIWATHPKHRHADAQTRAGLPEVLLPGGGQPGLPVVRDPGVHRAGPGHQGAGIDRDRADVGSERASMAVGQKYVPEMESW